MFSLLNSSKEEEKILVLLDFDLYSPNTILRGAQLAKALKSEFEVLFLLEFDADIFDQPELELMFAESRKLSKDLGANEFRVKEFKNYKLAFQFLKEFTRKMEFTQLVLNHEAESRWDEMIQGSYVNFLMKRMPFLEIHFVSQDFAFPYENWAYNKGVYAFLEPTRENDEYYLTETKSKKAAESGVFFKRSATDFDNGVFLSFTESKYFNAYKVYDGIATLDNSKIN